MHGPMMSCQVPHLVAFWRVLSRSRSPIGTADRINSFASSRKGLPFWKEGFNGWNKILL